MTDQTQTLGSEYPDARTQFNLKMFKAVVKESGPIPKFLIPLTPQLLACMESALARTPAQLVGVVISSDVWPTIVSDRDWFTILDPVSRREIILAGELAVIFGMTLFSDAFFHPDDRCIDSAHAYVFTYSADGTIGQSLGVRLAL